MTVVESLGIDLGPEVTQRKWAKSATQKKRLATAAKRAKRLGRIRKQVGAKINKVTNQLLPCGLWRPSGRRQ